MSRSIKEGSKMQCCGSGMTYYGFGTYAFQVIPDPNPIPD
jgi:hypothetical protein